MTKSKALRLLTEAIHARPCDHCAVALGAEPRIHYAFKQYHARCFVLTGLKPSVDGATIVGRLLARARAGLPPLPPNFRSMPL
jgi:hypothetical protein